MNNFGSVAELDALKIRSLAWPLLVPLPYPGSIPGADPTTKGAALTLTKRD